VSFRWRFDGTEACWKAEFTSPRVRSVWCLVVEGADSRATARLLPGNEVVRKVDLRGGMNGAIEQGDES